MFGDYFDPKSVNVINRARGGRSSRTFITEGHWSRLLAEIKPGDTVLIQFGHNDVGPLNGPRVARGSLAGLGDETETIENTLVGQVETVHSFGWYMRRMIADTRAKRATPILLSLTVRNLWEGDKVERGSGRYGEWTRELAIAERAAYIDLTRLIADRYDLLGHEVVNAFFPRDVVHTGADGARLNAALVVSGLKGLREQSLIRALSLMGRVQPAAIPEYVYVPPRSLRRDAERSVFETSLNVPEAADPKLPTIWLIGDSTVRNGRGDGSDGQFGWGAPFEKFLYPAKANFVNRAIGGLGARTFRAQWDDILPTVKRGDVVIMQFGHDDNGPRGALAGVGEQIEEREDPTTQRRETVHTFGWYLRRYIAEIREKGATPVVCSLVPRNRWKRGKIVRTSNGHAEWSQIVAAAERVAFLDLHGRIADEYDELGQEAVTALFADGVVHTNWAGAERNARVVFEAMKALPRNPLAEFLRPM